MKGFTLVNYDDHPTNRRKKVFFFSQHLHANYFEVMLVESKIKYEKQIDEEGDGRIYFGVDVRDYKKAMHFNHLTIGHYRKPFISDPFFRYLLISVSIILLALAFIGAWISKS